MGEMGFEALQTHVASPIPPLMAFLILEGVNEYEFGENQPPNLVDDNGKCPPCVVIIIGVTTGWLLGYFLAEALNPPEYHDPHDPMEPDPCPVDNRFPTGRRPSSPSRIPPQGEPPPGRLPIWAP